MMQAGDYEQIIKDDWPKYGARYFMKNLEMLTLCTF